MTLSFSFHIGRSTMGVILRETCKAIWKVLQSEYMKAPSTKAEWEGIARQFEQIWNFPHCIG